MLEAKSFSSYDIFEIPLKLLISSKLSGISWFSAFSAPLIPVKKSFSSKSSKNYLFLGEKL
jgi:hypothetical protein